MKFYSSKDNATYATENFGMSITQEMIICQCQMVNHIKNWLLIHPYNNTGYVEWVLNEKYTQITELLQIPILKDQMLVLNSMQMVN